VVADAADRRRQVRLGAVLGDVGYPVALAVISELLDVGVEGAQVFAELTPALARGIEFDATGEDLAAAAAASIEMTLFLTPILAHRRTHPGGDFISALLALESDDPDGLSLGEIMTMSMLLLIAGHETTANLIANSTLALLQNPQQIPHLLAEPARAVEELLRCHGPVKLLMRTALTDHEIAGHLGRAGESVLLDVRAANCDPNRFPGAERMDLTREPVGHLAFGAGIHFCLGAALARLETAEALTRLFTRHPNMQLTTRQVRCRESVVLHALQRLDVHLEP
jgi:cytochrome P450